MTPTPIPRIVVTAAVVERDGRFLVARRPRGVHLEGLWEFPGGKCDPGESLQQCLERELREELGAASRIGEKVMAVAHAYSERRVELHFFNCELLEDPRPVLGQELQWVSREGLSALSFPPADAELIERLRSGS
jgi:mutator protein MutT